MIVIPNAVVASFFMLVSLPIALLGGYLSWLAAERLSKHADVRVWMGIWMALPELAMMASGWLYLEDPLSLSIVTLVLVVGAVQCARAELRYLRGGERDTRWRLAPRAAVVISVAAFIVLKSFDDFSFAIPAALGSSAAVVWGTWPMRTGGDDGRDRG